MNKAKVNPEVHRQRNVITAMIVAGDYEQALILLQFSEALWTAYDCVYDVDDVKARLWDKLNYERNKAVNSECILKFTEMMENLS